MILLETQPRLTELHSLIAKVPSYPITVSQLIDLAARTRASKSVVEFYKAFPEDEIFSDRDDLITRTEQIDLLEMEDQPEENDIRGAED